jgi:molybdate transport system ATP-binding protein
MPVAKGWVKCRVGGFSLEVDWHIEEGQVLVLFGPSGAGKTTTLRAIAGLVRPEEGRVELGGRVVFDSAAGISVPVHGRQVGYLTQQYHLFPHLNVRENIAYGLSQRGQPEARAEVDRLVRMLRLDGLEDRRTWELSGGQQQRVALARALATSPQILLLDEPFASLDAELRRVLRRELRAMLVESPIPVMLVTHDREEALALGDSVQVIDDGRIVDQGEPLRVLGQPGRGRVARLAGVENLLAMTVESRNPQDGTMVCSGDGMKLEVPLDAAPTNQNDAPDQTRNILVGLRSSDIILAMEEPKGTSARNRLAGTVASVEPRPPGYEVTVDCGIPLKAQVTGAAMSELGIKPGQNLWAVFKASSCFLVQEDTPPARDTGAVS